MRIIELSDHPGEMLQSVQNERQLAEEQALADYEEALARHCAAIAEARARRARAWRERRWLTWLREVFAVRGEQLRAPQQPVFYRGTTAQEEILTAGMLGERLVQNHLGRVLGDEWVLLRGYKNSSGEIDHLLLGPRGLFAMEVKHRNAIVYIDGDEWQFDKYDRYGNLVDQGRMIDRGGRSPSRQVNEAADVLQRFLNQRGQRAVIERIVILTHPKSVLGSYANLTVWVTTDMDFVLGLVNESQTTLPSDEIAELERLIERDHRYHLAHQVAPRKGTPRHASAVPQARY